MNADRLRRGLVIWADDFDVGYQGDKEGRPFLVTRIEGDPPHTAWLVAGSASGWEGVPYKKRLVPGLTKDGMFSLDQFVVGVEDLERAEEGTVLPEPDLTRILSTIEGNLTDLI